MHYISKYSYCPVAGVYEIRVYYYKNTAIISHSYLPSKAKKMQEKSLFKKKFEGTLRTPFVTETTLGGPFQNLHVVALIAATMSVDAKISAAPMLHWWLQPCLPQTSRNLKFVKISAVHQLKKINHD